jgi:hypothetical protein
MMKKSKSKKKGIPSETVRSKRWVCVANSFGSREKEKRTTGEKKKKELLHEADRF